MQFIVTGHDGTDDGAPGRRAAAREAHLSGIESLRMVGTALFGAALLNDAGQMIGSTLIMEFPSREELDAWMKREPYMLGGVWKTVEITPCRVAPSFAKAT